MVVFTKKNINIHVVRLVGYIASYQENITSNNPANHDSLLEHMNSPAESAKSSIYAGVPFPARGSTMGAPAQCLPDCRSWLGERILATKNPISILSPFHHLQPPQGSRHQTCAPPSGKGSCKVTWWKSHHHKNKEAQKNNDRWGTPKTSFTLT